ncbi:hypothetical protein ILUMI_04368 [Ignelater luminosus]|uniref:Peptidase S1 domain-containing protein n=1 Tax=Ignelater luminosus TaxID=2038154 RepID=A0A8K0D9U5_IGNLU|nr:hypothetical protein ILUMI_04368 [Ignelater luminosus]
MKILYVYLMINLFQNGNCKFENSSSPRYRVVGGYRGDIKDFPAMASLVLKSPVGIDFRGGATIISEYWVVTAAHCSAYITDDDIINRLAYVRSNSTSWSKQYNEHLILKSYIHEKYDFNITDYDISIIKVREPFSGLYERPSKYAKLSYNYVDDSAVTTLGWGTTDADAEDPYVVTFLRYTRVNIINFETCKTRYREVNEVVTDRMVCASAPGRDACIYDSGGPLFQDNVLIGIVSWGSPKCADKILPGVYTKISLFHQWIRRKVMNESRWYKSSKRLRIGLHLPK